jgi:hypothetical protein
VFASIAITLTLITVHVSQFLSALITVNSTAGFVCVWGVTLWTALSRSALNAAQRTYKYSMDSNVCVWMGLQEMPMVSAERFRLFLRVTGMKSIAM